METLEEARKPATGIVIGLALSLSLWAVAGLVVVALFF